MKYCVHLSWKLKKKDGGEYKPTTLRSFISSFDRYLRIRKKGYPTTMIDEQDLRKTRETLVAKQKELKKAGKGSNSKAAGALSDDEVDILYSKKLLGLSSPEPLGFEQHPALWPERMPRA